MNYKFITIGNLSLTGLLLALITVYLNHLLANSREKIKRRRDQGQVLAIAFKPELDALIQTDQDCRLILNQQAYQKHERAIRDFMLYLSWIDKLKLQWRWARLAMLKIGKKQHIPFYEQYADCGSLDKRRMVRPVVIKRIQDIISFANK
jgi:hypothetical protein